LSDLFIRNEATRSKITTQYFQDAKSLNRPIVSQDIDSDSDISVEFEPEKRVETDDIEDSVHFLDTHDGDLEVLFDLCDFEVDITKQYTIYLCGYHLNTDEHRPFVQYMMQLESDEYSFPKINFRCPTNVQVSEEDDDGKSPNHVYFENECTKYILDMFEPETILSEEELKKLYKGYVHSQRLENTLYVIFDMSMFRIKRRENIRRHWATLDEIVNHKQLFGYHIDPDCAFVFYECPSLMRIQNAKGEILDIPRILFLCKKTSGTYENIYNEHDEREYEDAKYLTILDERSPHPILGDFFVFSTFPMDFHSQSIVRIRRFAGFLEKPLYITSGIHTPSMAARDEPSSLGKVIPNIVSYINKPNDDDEDNYDDPNQIETDNVQDEYIETTQLQEEIEALHTLDFGCAYFQEMIGNTKHTFWCIKSESHFVEL
jgi:hypothetical protein